ncbi:phage tail tape measure protein [Catenibacterium sp.]|uniref:phage tail tape measure protein n=1 Tax=Catenibacterium sp. TaxID=2049022 RepID=UPI003995B678
MCDTLPTVLNLAAAGEIDLAAASDMVTDAMSALGMGVDEAETMVDQMAKTASTANTSVAQLGEGILKIGATAKSVKGIIP